MLSIISIPPLLILLYLLSYLPPLLKNYLAALKTGFPILVLPIDPIHPLWILTTAPLRPYLKRHLPYNLYIRLAVAIYGWEYHEKRIVFRQLGCDSFMLVTCGKNELWTVDPEIVADVLRRPGVFGRTEIGDRILNVFGPNVFTSFGEAWGRQRGLVTRVINERISRIVFEEAWRQARDMVRDVEENGVGREGEGDEKRGLVYPGTFASMKRITANVLSRSAYGMPQDFKQSEEEKNRSSGVGGDTQADSELGMFDCVQLVLQNLVPAAILSKRLLLGWPSFLPGAVWAHRLGAARDQFPGHVKSRLQAERDLLGNASNGKVRNNLTSMLVQASEYGGEDGIELPPTKNGKPQQMLSEDELRGNLFVFTAAGYETTANALTFALVTLMAEPALQDWLFEEIDALFKNMQGSNTGSDEKQEVDYVAFYPKALRCLALMMEVLRVYPPVLHMDRQTLRNSAGTIFETSKKTYYMPPNCHLFTPMAPLHADPKVWRNLNLPQTQKGEDSRSSDDLVETVEDAFEMTKDEYIFRPARWINEQPTMMPDGSMAKILFQPSRGSFIPFSGGPRVCPGQKMAQVEFVCVILALFKDYRIEAVKRPGEDSVQVQRRLGEVLKDCHAELTIVMDRLHEVEVRFVQRT